MVQPAGRAPATPSTSAVAAATVTPPLDASTIGQSCGSDEALRLRQLTWLPGPHRAIGRSRARTNSSSDNDALATSSMPAIGSAPS